MTSAPPSAKRTNEDLVGVEETVMMQSQDRSGKRIAGLEVDDNAAAINDADMGEFEDAFEDELEQEDLIMNAEDEDEEILEEPEDDDEEEEPEQDQTQAYIPGHSEALKDGEVLECDPSAYKMLHNLHMEWPCLSFDILHDDLGQDRSGFPMTTYLCTATQADKRQNNKLILMKASRLCRMRNDIGIDSDPDASDDDEDMTVDEDPILEHVEIKHHGSCNRLRVMPHHQAHIVSTWSDTGKVLIWDVQECVQSFDTPGLTANRKLQPQYTVREHNDHEGFAMDWSLTKAGRLLTGDCNKRIVLTEKHDGGQWVSSTFNAKSHDGSVEDLQWSPNEVEVFASCSTDQHIKIWDTRMRQRCGLSVHAHPGSDVNVISWNKAVPHLMASGGDDGQFMIWDLRNFKAGSASASFNWHRKAITSLEWHPTDEAQLAVSAEDDQVTLWDFSVEKDAETQQDNVNMNAEIPPQLMFIHQGQENVKEVHWHRQLKDVVISTSACGMNIFKPCNAQ